MQIADRSQTERGLGCSRWPPTLSRVISPSRKGEFTWREACTMMGFRWWLFLLVVDAFLSWLKARSFPSSTLKVISKTSLRSSWAWGLKLLTKGLTGFDWLWKTKRQSAIVGSALKADKPINVTDTVDNAMLNIDADYEALCASYSLVTVWALDSRGIHIAPLIKGYGCRTVTWLTVKVLWWSTDWMFQASSHP